MQILTYWAKSENGIRETKFTKGQVHDRPWVIEDKHGNYIGLPFIQAAKLVEEWNKVGNKMGYFYYLHKPETVTQ